MTATCETCKFFVEPATDREVRRTLYSGQKECHRYPPPGLNFPVSHQDDWCGEYVAQPVSAKPKAKTT